MEIKRASSLKEVLLLFWYNGQDRFQPGRFFQYL